jgi:serine/threonine protein kinase/Tfp pilus assembly protein PilF
MSQLEADRLGSDLAPEAQGLAPDDPRVTGPLQEYLTALEAGQRPDRKQFLARHPEVAAALAECLDGLDFIHAAAPQLHQSLSRPEPSAPALADAIEPEGPLGDFRIVREVGRGGMGVVYEAVQISLGRRVALKVLPFAAALDAKQLQRFKNEAQAAAQLHHQSIVPVYAVGCERGVHYYAMQYIEGQTLAQLIGQLRREAAAKAPPTIAVSTGQESARAASSVEPPQMGEVRTPRPETRTIQAVSTERPNQDPEFFRTGARLGIQAAEALEHAHQLDVVHRDIKPANLLMDGRGHLWVTDFGLAHCQSQAGLTMTGDLVGTLRYMSPEQALAKRVMIDHRTDIYSLGATLYELLTLEPAFAGGDRQELLNQIAFEEPRPPRRVNRAVPAELETIVLKALEKNPADRYVSAQELADDLRRFLEDRPIRARRPTWLQKARKWGQRNKAAVRTAVVCSLLALAVLAGSIGWEVRDRAARQAAAAVQADLALQEAKRLQEQEKWPEALSAVKRAEGILAVGADPLLNQRAQEQARDLEMAIKLEDIRLSSVAGPDGRYDFVGRGRAYAAAFREYGIDLAVLDPPEAAQQVRTKSIQAELVTALDDWAFMVCGPTPERAGLLAIARAADADVWRNQLRDALEHGDRAVLRELAASERVANLPASSLKLLGDYLLMTGAPAEEAVALLGKARWQHVTNFWFNESLATWLQQTDPPRLDEAAGFWRAALALRPRAPQVYYDFGDILLRKGSLSEAEAAYRKAIELKPDIADTRPHFGLVHALLKQGKFTEANEVCARALNYMTDEHAFTLNDIAWELATLPNSPGRSAQMAVEVARRAVAGEPSVGDIWNTLGVAHYQAGNWKEAVAALERSMALRQAGNSLDWFFLGMAHWHLGDKARAGKWYTAALLWMQKHNPTDGDLVRLRSEAAALLGQPEQPPQSPKQSTPDDVAIFTLVLDAQPGDVGARGAVYAALGQWDRAATAMEQSLQVHGDVVFAHYLHALVCLGAEDRAGYRRACATMLGRFGQSEKRGVAHWVTWASVLTPDTVKDWDPIVNAAEQAIREDPWARAGIAQLGAALYRAGRTREAIQRLDEAAAA